MNNSNTITFKYNYPEGTTDVRKDEIDSIIIDKVNKAFWELYHEGHILMYFCLIDEDMGVIK